MKRIKQLIVFLLVTAVLTMGSGVVPHVLPPELAHASSSPCVGANCVNLNSSTHYQTMQGWQGTAEAGQNEFPAAFSEYKTSLFDNLVNDLGINSLRVEIYSGEENPTDYFLQYRAGTINESQYTSHFYDIQNDNGDPNSINAAGFSFGKVDSQINEVALPMKTLLAARGETLHLSFCYVDFGSSAFEHKSNPSEYAEFVLATYQHMQSTFGFVPDSWEVILEPDNGSASWSTTQVANAVKAAGDKLVANGFTPHFVAPSVLDLTNADSYINQIQATSGAVPYMDSYSYHLYGFQDDSLRSTVASEAATDGIKTGMLEYIGADENQLRRDIISGKVSTWQQYTLTYPDVADDGGGYYTVSSGSPHNLTIGSRTKKLRQYFKYIRSGAVRIATSDSGNPFISGATTAYINTGNKYVVVAPIAATTSFGVNDLPAGTYGIYYTTDGGSTVTLANQTIPTGGSVNVSSIPAGVLTIYDTALDSPPSDTTPPTFTINNGTAAGPVQSDTINVTINDASSISSSQYGFSADNTCNGSDTYSTTFSSAVDFSVAGDRTNYLCVKATDSFSNTGYQLVGQLNTDNTVPVRSSGAPTGVQASGTTSVNLTLSTNETATCKYGITSGVAYTSIASTFGTTNSTSHSQTISGLSDGNSYTYYVRCRDVATNTNPDDYTISFSVASAPDTTPPTFTINNGTAAGPVQLDTINVTINDASSISLSEYGFSTDNTCNGSDTYGNSFTSATNFTAAGDHTNYLCVKATDSATNTGYQLIGQLNTDNTAPIRSSGAPSGAQAMGTTSVNLTLNTNETATCKYGTTPGVAYGSIASTFSTTNSTSHSQNITGLTNGSSYNYYVRCQDVATNADSSDFTISFSVASDGTPPTVSITAPADGATVSGSSVSVTANASDNVGVVGVQFKLDGSNLGSEDTTSTYGITWDTTGASNGLHTLTAVARDAATNSTTSTAINVTVNNVVPPSTVATPSISPNGGSFSSAQSVTLSSTTGGANIYYTIDGTTPTTSSTLYSTPFLVSSTTTVKAFATHSSMTDSSVSSATFTITISSGGGSSGGSGSSGKPKPLPTPPLANGAKLINNAGTFYYVVNGQRKGVTSPGILNSCGFDFSNASTATTTDNTLPLGSLLLPCDGALVKSNEDKTVYFISSGQRYAFTSAAVFANLGFKFTSVLTVTNPELQAMGRATDLSSGTSAHLPGTDININGTIYWIDIGNIKRAYPSLAIYNSWHIDNDFSNVVPANAADLSLATGPVVPSR